MSNETYTPAYTAGSSSDNPLPVANGGTGASLTSPLIVNNSKISIRNSRFPFISRSSVRQVMASPPSVSWSNTVPTGTFTASQSGTTVTITATSIFVLPGMAYTGAGVTAGSVLVSQLTGTTGSTGTYQSNLSSTVASPVTMTATLQNYLSTDQGSGSSGGRPVANRFSYSSARNLIIQGASGPQRNFVRGSNVSSYNSSVLAPSANTLNVGFTHTGWGFVIVMGNYGESLLLQVDDQYTTLTPQTFASTNNTSYGVVLFSSYAKRRINIKCAGGSFGGIMCGLNDIVVPSEIRGPSVFCVGDSFIGGATPFTPNQSWFQCMADYMGWDDAVSSGCGGSGFIADSSASPNGGKPYLQRLATDVIPFNPDIVIFQPSVNDAAQTPAAIVAAATLCFQSIQASCPNTLIACMSPMQSTGNSFITTGNNVLAQTAPLQALCASMGVLFLNIQNQPFPANYSPQAGTLSANVTAGLNKSFTTPVALKQGGTYQFADGSQINIVSASGGSAPFTNVADNFPNAQPIGATLIEVGSPLVTGNGNQPGGVGNGPTGYGTADSWISPDNLHPMPVGCDGWGEASTNRLLNILYSN